MPLSLLKAFIAEDDHLVSDLVHQMLERGTAMEISRGAIPINDEAQLIDQQTQPAPPSSPPAL